MIGLLLAGIVALVAVVFSPRLRARLSRPLWEPPASGGTAAAHPEPDDSQPASTGSLPAVPPVPRIVDEDTWARYEAAGFPDLWEAS